MLSGSEVEALASKVPGVPSSNKVGPVKMAVGALSVIVKVWESVPVEPSSSVTVRVTA